MSKCTYNQQPSYLQFTVTPHRITSHRIRNTHTHTHTHTHKTARNGCYHNTPACAPPRHNTMREEITACSTARARGSIGTPRNTASSAGVCSRGKGWLGGDYVSVYVRVHECVYVYERVCDCVRVLRRAAA